MNSEKLSSRESPNRQGRAPIPKPGLANTAIRPSDEADEQLTLQDGSVHDCGDVISHHCKI